jgi:DNA-binding SARP family transcriptional activator
MLIRILGPIELSRDGERVPLGAAKQRTVLAVLAAEAGHCVSVDCLIDRVWGADPPQHPRTSLHAYTSRLRGALVRAGSGTGQPSLRFRAGGYVLAIDPRDVDLHRARHLAATAATAADKAETAAMLAQALGEWGRYPLAGIDGEWAAAKRAALVRERICLIVRYADVRLSLGQHFQLLDELVNLSAEYPAEEQLAARSMVTLYKCGFRDESLKTYRRLRERLVDELGVEPCAELQALQRDILAGTAPMAARPEPSACAPRSGRPMQLPHRTTHFCGRDEEISELSRFIREAPPGITPVISIRGPAGIGKSALAIEAAHRLADRYPDGQLYARFRPGHQDKAELVPEQIAGCFLGALGVPSGSVPDGHGGTSARLRSALARQKVLILLDDVTAALDVTPLIPAGPGCVVLTTSRGLVPGLQASASIRLGPLRTDAAIALISRMAGRKEVTADLAAAVKIAMLCGYHPLALRIAGLRLDALPELGMRVLATRLAEESTRLDELRFGGLSVRESLSASYTSVVASASGTLPARLFRLFGLWDEKEVGADKIAAAAAVPVETAELALEHLLTEHLIEPSGPGRYRIGVLAWLFARELLHQELELSARGPRDRDRPGRRLRSEDRLRSGDRPGGEPDPGHSDRRGLPGP